MRGGSERVFFEDMSILESGGHKVVPFSRKHSENLDSEYSKYFSPDLQTDRVKISLDGLRTLKEIISSNECARDISKLLIDFKPEIVHAHNIYGRITTSVLKVLNKKNIPIVMTLHDYKLVCPSYKLETKGEVCERCQGKSFYNAVINRCLKDSYIASSVYAVESYYNSLLKRYHNYIDMLISPSQFLKDKLIQFGWDENKIRVVRNSLNIENYTTNYAPGNYILYIGRLSREKGIKTLISAYSELKTDKQLIIAGSGPLEDELKEQARDQENITFTGHLSGSELSNLTSHSRAVIVPSEWYENAPMSILEAMAYGKPVVAADIGGIYELIDHGVTGLLYESGNTQKLKHELIKVLEDMSEDELISMGKDARIKAEVNHSQHVHYEDLINVYSEVLSKPCESLA